MKRSSHPLAVLQAAVAISNRKGLTHCVSIPFALPHLVSLLLCGHIPYDHLEHTNALPPGIPRLHQLRELLSSLMTMKR